MPSVSETQTLASIRDREIKNYSESIAEQVTQAVRVSVRLAIDNSLHYPDDVYNNDLHGVVRTAIEAEALRLIFLSVEETYAAAAADRNDAWRRRLA